MTNSKKTIAITLLGALFAQSSYAVTCQGVPVAPAIEPTTGDVLISSVGGLIWPRLCSLKTTTPQGVTPDTCKSIYATVLNAQSSGRALTISTTSSYASCAAVPQWQYLEGFSFLVING